MMNIIEVTDEQASMDIEEFFNASIGVFRCLSFFAFGIGLIVLMLWLKSGVSLWENGVSESLDAITLRRDTVLRN